MTDDTRDALLMAVAEAIGRLGGLVQLPMGMANEEMRECWATFDQCALLLARARHEQERPEDRG